MIAIQYELLKTGIILEKDRFDQKIEAVLDQVNLTLDQRQELRNKLTQIYTQNNREVDASLVSEIRDSLENILSETLKQRKLNISYSFSVMDIFPGRNVLQSKDFAQERFDFAIYQEQLKGKLVRECHCALYLKLHVRNLFKYLLSRLAVLIIPSILFFLLVLACLLFLILTLNKQKRLGRIKNDFINNLTHELKTPVFSISLMVKMLKELVSNDKKEKSLEYLGLIEKENKVMKGHIEKVLELASLENGRYVLNKELQDLHRLVEEVVSAFEIKIADRMGKVQRQFQADPIEIKVDATHFKNALQNILENAVKYNNNVPEITIHTQNERNRLLIGIQDNGIGIAPEDQKHIFDKFFRVSLGNLHDIKGFGLGLSYVKQIIEAHGGSIKVLSQLGKGSLFQIILPVSNVKL